MAEYPSINDLDPDIAISFVDSMDNIDQAPVMKSSGKCLIHKISNEIDCLRNVH